MGTFELYLFEVKKQFTDLEWSYHQETHFVSTCDLDN